MSIKPINIQLFADTSQQDSTLLRCSYESYLTLKRNNQLSSNDLYFVSYSTPDSPTTMQISDALFVGETLIGNSGVIFLEANNGVVVINGEDVSVNLTAPTALTSALPGILGQSLFIVNHSVYNGNDQYNTFLFIWKESSNGDGEWINANLTLTMNSSAQDIYNELINTGMLKKDSPHTEYDLILNGYTGNETDVSQSATWAPFIISPSYSQYYQGVPITDIELRINQAGILSIGRIRAYENIETASFNQATDILEVIRLDVPATGFQRISLPHSITVNQGENLFLGLPDDGSYESGKSEARFYYGSNPTNRTVRFYYRKTDYSGFVYQSKSIGINFYATHIIGSSDKLSAKSNYNNKTLSILGDSISAYEGYISSGNAKWYPNASINDVKQMWWYKVCQSLSVSINTNNSCSGSCVSWVRNSRPAGLSRCESLGTNPDIIIVWMGINDFIYADGNYLLGSYDGTSAIPNVKAPTTFSEGYAAMLNKILTNNKEAEVYVCTLPETDFSAIGTASQFPKINGNNNSLKQYNDTITNIANAFGVKIIDLHKAGITWQNIQNDSTSTLSTNIYTDDKLHPNVAGHDLIAKYIIKTLDPMMRTENV